MRFLDKIGRVKLLVVILALVIAILATLVLVGLDREPEVDGHTVTEWALQYSGYAKRMDIPLDQPANEIRKCGQAGAPYLAHLLEAREPAWKTKLIQWTQKQHWFPVHLLTAEQKRKTGLYGLSFLGTNMGSSLDRLAKFNSATNVGEQVAFKQVVSMLTGHPQSNHFNLSEGHILKVSSGSESQYFAYFNDPGSSIPGKSYLNLALLNSNAVKLDWISMRRSTRCGPMFLTNMNNGNIFSVLAKTGMWGQSLPINVGSSRTNFDVHFPAETTNDVLALYIGIKRDRFIFGNRVEDVR